MSISRRDAIKRLEGLAAVVEEHMLKIANHADHPSAMHWRHEIESWIEQMEAVLPVAGKKTEATWRARILRWHETLGGE